MDIYRPVYHSARALIGGMFIYTGIIHAFDPQGFAQAVRAYQFLPLWSVGPFALILPWVELLAGLALATGIWIRGGALAIIGMLTAFSIALAAGLYRGLDIACGCFSTAPEAARITWLYLVRDLALLFATIFVFQHPALAPEKQRVPSSSLPGKLLVPVLAGLIVAAIFLFQPLTMDPCAKVTIESINRHKQFAAPVMVAKRSVNGLCEVMIRTENQTLPVYVGDTFVIAGGMFQDRKNIAEEGVRRLISNRFLSWRGDVDRALAFSYRPKGAIRHTLYLFASPTCPHCEEILTDIKPVLDRTHTELKVLFMARGESQNLAILAICSKVDLSTYISRQWMVASEKKARPCIAGIGTMEHSNELARKIGVTSVPTLFTEKGMMLMGARMADIEALLEN